MIATWAWKRSPQIVYGIVFGIVLWGMVFILLGFSLSVLQLNRPIESARPYFTSSKTSISPALVDDGARAFFTALEVSVRNNDRPAKNFVSQMLILDERIDSTIQPLHSGRIKNANDIGRSQTINHRVTGHVRLNSRSAFIVFEIKYADVLTDKNYSQIWFLKFTRSLQDGKLIWSFFEAKYGERTKIETYIEQRDIPMFSGEQNVPR